VAHDWFGSKIVGNDGQEAFVDAISASVGHGPHGNGHEGLQISPVKMYMLLLAFDNKQRPDFQLL
jgi:hypothetical protein